MTAWAVASGGWWSIACVGFACTPEPIIEQVHAAFEGGELTIDEMLEVVLHFAVYCGWPKASNLEMYVRQTWARMQEERGEEPTPLPLRPTDVTELGPNDWEARIARGEEEFRDVNLVPAPGRDSPYQHAGILNFVFGHVWQRPGLGRRDRRFLTVACVGVDEAPIPILSHVGSALESGDITKPEMDELITDVPRVRQRRARRCPPGRGRQPLAASGHARSMSLLAPSARLVGNRISRKEDPRLLTGRGRYVDDIVVPGMLHVAFARSDIAARPHRRASTSTRRARPTVSSRC